MEKMMQTKIKDNVVVNDINNIKILLEGRYEEFDFKIISYGSHPCAYVKVPKNHDYYGLNYEEVDIDCHGGLTYSGMLPISNDVGYWIGWDYGHYGDYIEINNLPLNLGLNLRKWKTEEIYKEIEDVIDQLITIDNSKDDNKELL